MNDKTTPKSIPSSEPEVRGPDTSIIEPSIVAFLLAGFAFVFLPASTREPHLIGLLLTDLETEARLLVMLCAVGLSIPVCLVASLATLAVTFLLRCLIPVNWLRYVVFTLAAMLIGPAVAILLY